MSPLGAGLYVGTGSMTLGVSGAAPQMSSVFGNQAQSSSSASATAAAQFDHIIPSSSPASSMFLSQAPASSSSFFLGVGGGPSPSQVFSEDGDLSQGSQQSSRSHLLRGKSPAAGFNGLMQLPEQSQQGTNASGYNVLNLRFFSSNSGGAAGGQDARLAIQDQFNGGGGGNSNAEQQRSVMASLGNHLSGNLSSLYNSSGSSAVGGLPQNSATALLLKAAQMGSTASSNHNNTSVLLRAAGFSGANASQGNRDAGEGSSAPAHETHFHDLIMNSLAGGSGSFSGGTAGLDDGKLSTRDFLGVGRGSMAPLGLHIGALDPAQMK
jgi:hypothetical protein